MKPHPDGRELHIGTPKTPAKHGDPPRIPTPTEQTTTVHIPALCAFHRPSIARASTSAGAARRWSRSPAAAAYPSGAGARHSSLRLGLRLGLRLAQLQIITALAQPIFGALQFRARFWVLIADNARAKTRRPPRYRRGSAASPTFVCDAAEAAPFFRSWELQCLPLRHAVWLPYGRGSVGRRMLSFVRARGRLPRFRAAVSTGVCATSSLSCLACSATLAQVP